MKTSTKLILANGMIAIVVMVVYAYYSLGRFHDQQASQTARELESRLGTFKALLLHKGEYLRVVDGKLLAGSYVVNGNYEVPDQVQKIFGGVATIFLGDTRISTNVLRPDGTRAIGTRLEGPAYRAVFLEGRSFRGEAPILGIPYLTAYDPLRDQHGRIIGAIFVGMEKSAFLARISGMGTHLALFLLALVALLAFLTHKIYLMARRLERFREEQRELAESLVQHSTAATFVLDAEHRVIIWNRALEELTGVRAAQMVGTDGAWKAFYPEQRPVLADFVIAGGQPAPGAGYSSSGDCPLIPEGFQAERWFEELNGRRRYIQFHAAPLRDAGGKLTAVIQTIEDITAHKTAEEGTQKAYSLLSATLEATADGILVRDLAGRLTRYNSKFAEIWGLPGALLATGDDAALRTFSCRQLKDPGNFLKLTEDSYRMPQMETWDVLEFLDGRVVERVSKPQYLGSEVVGRVISIRDVTERTTVEKARLESEERYRSLIENIDLGITLIDKHYQVVMTNACAAAMFDKPEDALVHKECFREFEGRDAVCPHCAGKKCLETGKPAAMETERVRLDGSRIRVKVNAFPIFDAGGQATQFIEVIQDVTDQKRAEAEKAGMELQLRQAQKMEAIGTLAGGVAHDFNNILMVIVGYGGMVRSSLKQEDPLAKFVDHILEAADRAASLTKGLLAYSRQQTLALGQVDVGEILHQIDALLSRMIREDIELVVVPLQTSLRLHVDSNHIIQVLMNLATNARDAMPTGGTITIKVEELTMDQGFITSHGFGSEGRYASFIVSDTGCGMDETTQQRIFEPFFTTKEVGKGTGLGLANVYGIVKQHNGFTEVVSKPGQGTVFSLYFPVSEQEAVQVKKEQTVAHSRKGETVLVVEDNKEVREMLRQTLETNGYRTLVAIDGEEGVEKFRKYQDEIDLILMDVIMPRMNGQRAFEEIRGLRPGVKIIFMSGYTADIISQKGFEGKEFEFLTKPVFPEALLLKVRKTINS